MSLGHFRFLRFFTPSPPSNEKCVLENATEWKCPTVFKSSRPPPLPSKSVSSDINCEWSLTCRGMRCSFFIFACFAALPLLHSVIDTVFFLFTLKCHSLAIILVWRCSPDQWDFWGSPGLVHTPMFTRVDFVLIGGVAFCVIWSIWMSHAWSPWIKPINCHICRVFLVLVCFHQEYRFLIGVSVCSDRGRFAKFWSISLSHARPSLSH